MPLELLPEVLSRDAQERLTNQGVVLAVFPGCTVQVPLCVHAFVQAPDCVAATVAATVPVTSARVGTWERHEVRPGRRGTFPDSYFGQALPGEARALGAVQTKQRG